MFHTQGCRLVVLSGGWRALEGTDMASTGSVWLEGKERQVEPWPQVRLGVLVWETGSQQMQEANGKGYNPESLLNENSCNGGLVKGCACGQP